MGHAVRAPAGRAWAGRGDPERPGHIRLGGRVQSVRRARRRPGHVAVDPRAAVARRRGRTIGPSYVGFVQWAIADARDLAAMSIHVSASQFYDQTYTGGSLSLDTLASWMVILAAQESRAAPLAINRGLRGLRTTLAELPLGDLDERATGGRCRGSSRRSATLTAPAPTGRPEILSDRARRHRRGVVRRRVVRHPAAVDARRL